MTLKQIALPTLAVVLLSTASLSFAQGYPQQGPPSGYQQGPPGGDRGGWDAPPQDFRSDVQRQGFRDGMAGARQDMEAHRAPNSGVRREYRKPPVPRYARNEYREGYQRGYDVAFRHMMEHRDERRDGYYPPPR